MSLESQHRRLVVKSALAKGPPEKRLYAHKVRLMRRQLKGPQRSSPLAVLGRFMAWQRKVGRNGKVVARRLRPRLIRHWHADWLTSLRAEQRRPYVAREGAPVRILHLARPQPRATFNSGSTPLPLHPKAPVRPKERVRSQQQRALFRRLPWPPCE